jgi:hypothetical protein
VTELWPNSSSHRRKAMFASRTRRPRFRFEVVRDVEQRSACSEEVRTPTLDLHPHGSTARQHQAQRIVAGCKSYFGLAV